MVDVQLARGSTRAADIVDIWPGIKTADDRLGWRETASAVPWSRPSRGITGDLGRSPTGQLHMSTEGGGDG
jgi:hypothetical protein